jgi:hypothetical protein
VSEYLVDLSNESSNHPMYVMARCPICEEKILDPDEDCGTGKNHPKIVECHILQHDPEDLGLDDYEFRPMADILIELHDLRQKSEEAV